MVDLTQDFSASKAQGPLYCARDSHWNGRTIVSTAQKLAGVIKGAVGKTVELEAREEQIEIQGDLGGDKETVTLRFINPKGKTARLEPDRAMSSVSAVQAQPRHASVSPAGRGSIPITSPARKSLSGASECGN